MDLLSLAPENTIGEMKTRSCRVFVRSAKMVDLITGFFRILERAKVDFSLVYCR